MLSKKILCGVVAYTTLSSGSVGSYVTGGIEPKDIPSVIVNNPLLSAGAFAAVTTAILTYKILAKNYGCKIPLVESKDENVNVDVPLHHGLPEPEEGPIEKDKKEDPREDNVEPLYTEDALLNRGFGLKNGNLLWAIGGIVVVAVAITYLVCKYKEALRKERFTSCKNKWERYCRKLKNDHIEIQGKRYNLRTVFKAIIDLREDEQGKEVFESYWNYVDDTLGGKKKVVYSDLFEKNNCSSDIVSSYGLAMDLKGDNKGTISDLEEKEKRLLELIEDLRKRFLEYFKAKIEEDEFLILAKVKAAVSSAKRLLEGVNVDIKGEAISGEEVFDVLFNYGDFCHDGSVFSKEFYKKSFKDKIVYTQHILDTAFETVYRILDGNLTGEDIESFNSKKEEYSKKQQEKTDLISLNLNLMD